LTESPTAATILTLLGGIFFVIGGGVVVLIGALVGSLGSLGSLGNLGGLGFGNLTSTAGSANGSGLSSIVALGEFGVLLGIATVVLAVLIHMYPARHQLLGALVITFSVVSWVGSIGGLLIGFILGLIGGVMAITWKPAGTALVQITRICPNCGTVIQKDAKFCSYCGRSLP